MFQAKNLLQAFDRIADYWSPKVIGRVNDQLLKAAKLKGHLVWHAHANEDELFYVVKGHMRIELEQQVIDLHEGDFSPCRVAYDTTRWRKRSAGSC